MHTPKFIAVFFMIFALFLNTLYYMFLYTFHINLFLLWVCILYFINSFSMNDKRIFENLIYTTKEKPIWECIPFYTFIHYSYLLCCLYLLYLFFDICLTTFSFSISVIFFNSISVVTFLFILLHLHFFHNCTFQIYWKISKHFFKLY